MTASTIDTGQTTVVVVAPADDPDDQAEPSGSAALPRRRAPLLVFPVAVVVVFLALVGLGWNGSSSAAVRTQLEGSTPDSQHVFGEPNLLRTDEWFVNTPLVMSQDSYGYDRVSEDQLGGLDLSVSSAVPYREWSTLFRPQFWAFFVLPFQNAFAFYWWLPALVLALGFYGMFLAICPRRPLMAAGAGVAILFAPFVQWWFLTITLGSLGWAAVLVASFVMLERAQSRRAMAAWCVVIAYATTALLLLLYPGFQIACAWVVVAAVVGWTFRSGVASSWPSRARRLGLGAAAGGTGLALFGLFLLTRWDVIQAQAGTEYPGERVVPTGEGRLTWFLSGFLDRGLDADATWPALIGSNSSEASGFVYLGLFLVVAAGWLLLRSWRHDRTLDGFLVALLALLAGYLAFLFVPGLDLLARVTLLSQVSPQRLFIGVGLLSYLLTAAVIREMDRQEVRPPWGIVAVTGALALVTLGRTGYLVEQIAPGLSGSATTWVILTLLVTALVAAAARGHGGLALLGLAAFSMASTYRVNPVYDGVYDTRETAIGEAVVAVDRADPGGWVAVGSTSIQAVLGQQPVSRLSGMAFYPNLDAWERLDPDGSERAVYNRSAMVWFTEDPAAPDISTPAPDQVLLRLDACAPTAQALVGHVLSDHPAVDPCLRLRRTVPMPSWEFYIYDVVPPSTTGAGGPPSAD